MTGPTATTSYLDDVQTDTAATPTSTDLASTTTYRPRRGTTAKVLLALRRAFAHLVMAPGTKALLIDDLNAAIGWVGLDDALGTGPAFAVQVADDVLAVDADSPALAARARALAEEVRSAGHDPVLVASGRPDHLHVFARIKDAGRLASFKARARGDGLDVRKVIRPPLAPHRMGYTSVLLDPEDPAEALAALTPPTTRPLSPRMRRLLRDGDAERYPSRSEVVQALATAHVDAGLTVDDFRRAVLDPANAGGHKVRDMGEREAAVYVDRTWAKANDFVASRPAARVREDVSARLRAVRDAVESQTWRGRAGLTDLAILRAHLAIAERIGSVEHGASAREVAELARVHYMTVTRSWPRLVERGFLRRRTRRSGSTSSSWTLAAPRSGGAKRNRPLQSSLTQGGCEGTVADGYIPSDLWRWAGDGMGKACGRTYEAMTQPRTTAELAVRLGVGAPAVRKQARRLAGVGLLTREGRVWRRTARTIESVLATRSVKGETDRQHDRHEDDRVWYRVWYREHLARRAEETEWYERLASRAVEERWARAIKMRPRAADLTDNDYGDATRIVEAAATVMVVEKEAGSVATAAVRTERLDAVP